MLIACGLAAVFLAPVGARAAGGFDSSDSLEYQQRSKGMPDDVKRYLANLIECHHWKNEPAYDKAREKLIKGLLYRKGCYRIDKTAKLLRAKYKRKLPIYNTVMAARRDFKN